MSVIDRLVSKLRRGLASNKYGRMALLLVGPWFLLPESMSETSNNTSPYARFARGASPAFLAAGLLSLAFPFFTKTIFTTVNHDIPGRSGSEYAAFVDQLEFMARWGSFGAGVLVVYVVATSGYMWHRGVVWISSKFRKSLRIWPFSYFAMRASVGISWLAIGIVVMGLLLPFVMRRSAVDIQGMISEYSVEIVATLFIIWLLDKMKERNRAIEIAQLYGDRTVALASLVAGFCVTAGFMALAPYVPAILQLM